MSWKNGDEAREKNKTALAREERMLGGVGHLCICFPPLMLVCSLAWTTGCEHIKVTYGMWNIYAIAGEYYKSLQVGRAISGSGWQRSQSCSALAWSFSCQELCVGGEIFDVILFGGVLDFLFFFLWMCPTKIFCSRWLDIIYFSTTYKLGCIQYDMWWFFWKHFFL